MNALNGFVKLVGFNEESNSMYNIALGIAGSSDCKYVYPTHIIMAMWIMYVKEGRENKLMKFIESINPSYLMALEGVFVHQLREGKYETLEVDEEGNFTEELSVESITYELNDILNKCITKSFKSRKSVTIEDLTDEILENPDENVVDLFKRIGITIDALKDYKNVSIIPNRLKGFVENINETVRNSNEKYYGNDEYIEILEENLGRKNKANTCIVGEAGVGKTTIVYDLAKRINEGKVSEHLINKKIYYINGATIKSGTKYRGEYEERLEELIKWAQSDEVLLFIDEIHSFLGGSDKGDNNINSDAFKRCLAEGSIRIIGATTRKEYHSSIEQDPALKRRFEILEVKERSKEETARIVKNSIESYIDYHNVYIEDKMVEYVVDICDKYINDRNFPDKAFDVIDKACAYSKMHNTYVLRKDAVNKAVSDMTGVRVEQDSSDSEIKKLAELEKNLNSRIIAQEEAVKAVASAIKRSRLGISDRGKPVATFLFVGPTGVGKTEMSKQLSKQLGLGKDKYLKVDMSEFNDRSSITRFIGATPGYVGYGEGGVLTEFVKHNPYSVIVFDEIEKAHADVFNIFLQILDEGRLTDGEGQTVDFTKSIIIMTSNAGYGAELINKRSIGFKVDDDKESKSKIGYSEKEKIAFEELEKTFKTELLNRFDNIIIFNKLDEKDCSKVAKLELEKLKSRLKDKNIDIMFNPSVIKYIINEGYSDKYGARNIRRVIQNSIENKIADEMISMNVKQDGRYIMTTRNKELAIKYNDK